MTPTRHLDAPHHHTVLWAQTPRGSLSPGRWRASKDFFKCREFAGSVTAERVTAGFIFLRRCLSDLEPREKIKAPPSTAVFR